MKAIKWAIYALITVVVFTCAFHMGEGVNEFDKNVTGQE